MLAHLPQALRHTPVLIHYHHLSTHQTAGGILIIFQQVNDVACLVNVINLFQHFLLLLVIHVTDNLHSIVGIHVIDESFGDDIRRNDVQKLVSSVLVHLDEYVGRLLVVE